MNAFDVHVKLISRANPSHEWWLILSMKASILLSVLASAWLRNDVYMYKMCDYYFSKIDV